MGWCDVCNQKPSTGLTTGTIYDTMLSSFDMSAIALSLISVASLIIAFIVIRNHLHTIILFLGDRGIGSNSEIYQEYDDTRYEIKRNGD